MPIMTDRKWHSWAKRVANNPDDPMFENFAYAILCPAYYAVGISGILNGQWPYHEICNVQKSIRDQKDPLCRPLRRILYELASARIPSLSVTKNKRVIWETCLSDSIQEAQKMFDKFVSTGWRVFYVGLGAKPGNRMVRFDSSAEEMILHWPHGSGGKSGRL